MMENTMAKLFCCVLFGLLTCSPALAAQPPNIVVFISDDHGYLDSSLHGQHEIRTPNLERLASAGMSFDLAFAASPTCAPSRAAFLTGLFPLRNGSMLNHQPPRAEVKKLPAYFHEMGYEVDAFGKVTHYNQAKSYGFDRVELEGFHQDQCVQAAVDFLKNRKSEKPLCLFVGTNWPHVPWPAATSDLDPSALHLPPTHIDTPATRRWRARYVAAVEQYDRDLGLIYDAVLKYVGRDTMFVHFSDHGAQWPFGKWDLYDAGTRVTFLAAWPGHIAPATKSNAMVSLVDLLPSLIELSGATPPSDIDGKSFANVLLGKRSDHREKIYATHSGDGKMNKFPCRSLRTDRWKYIRNLDPAAEHHSHIDLGKPVDGSEYWASWVEAAKTDKRAAAIAERYFHRPAEELYDLHADPFEQKNLSADPQFAGVLKELRANLDDWMAQQSDLGLATERAVAAEFLGKKGNAK
jgi:uncharacterized sulfatase